MGTVFTNGCFDILHIGHVRYLQKARSLGDCLIVGINSDASLRRHKGREPVFPEDDRADILRALVCVDKVAIFDEDTPLELIARIQPDLLVKGDDYKPEDVVGREYATEVRCISVDVSLHTSDILRKIRLDL